MLVQAADSIAVAAIPLRGLFEIALILEGLVIRIIGRAKALDDGIGELLDPGFAFGVAHINR